MWGRVTKLSTQTQVGAGIQGQPSAILRERSHKSHCLLLLYEEAIPGKILLKSAVWEQDLTTRVPAATGRAVTRFGRPFVPALELMYEYTFSPENTRANPTSCWLMASAALGSITA